MFSEGLTEEEWDRRGCGILGICQKCRKHECVCHRSKARKYRPHEHPANHMQHFKIGMDGYGI